MTRRSKWYFVCTGILMGILLMLPTAQICAETPSSDTSGRLFTQTGFKVSNQAFLDFFDHRGGVRTFGYPVSRECKLNGSTVQFFQRAILQLRADGSVTTLNMLDSGLMPYTHINQSLFPAIDQTVLGKAPAPGSSGYGTAILNYVKENAPDKWQSSQVNFYQTFLNTVRATDAFTNGNGNTALLTGFDLELWGVPTSAPTVDSTNNNFIYQRFQRGIMHYDKTTGKTQGLLLADYLKAIIVGDNLPADLAAEAKSSPLYLQYEPSATGWVARPKDLANSDFTLAFEPDSGTNNTSKYGGSRIATEAQKYIGKKYAWGGTSPTSGFDCTGLVYYVMKQLGYTSTPRDISGQAALGKKVNKADLLPGDLIFFQNTYTTGISHVGIYLGNNQFVSAEDEKVGVRISRLDSTYWTTHFLSATRPYL